MTLRYDPIWRLRRYERESRQAYERNMSLLAYFWIAFCLLMTAGIIAMMFA